MIKSPFIINFDFYFLIYKDKSQYEKMFKMWRN